MRTEVDQLIMRPLRAKDLATIAEWPTYPAEFAELDYALRQPDGWAQQAWVRDDTQLFGFEEAGELVAFSLLIRADDATAEFRIALRADQIGKGHGAAMTQSTLAYGFDKLELREIHLIVRKNNPRAYHLYQKLGFVAIGECEKVVNHRVVPFIEMRISR